MKPQWLDRALVAGPYYTLCTTEKQFQGELKKLGLAKEKWPSFLGSKFADATTHLLENQEGDLTALVTVQADAEHSGVQVAAMLVHEAVHIWQEFRARIGETNPSSEFEAYAVQTISQRLMEEYVRQNVTA